MLAMIDLKTLLLPNALTLSLLAIGVIFSLAGLTIPIGDAILGAFLGAAFLILACIIYKLMSRREGVGYGDVELILC